MDHHDFPHYICDSQPFCLCVGHENEWDECDCQAIDRTAPSTECAGCEARMHAIDVNTGRVLGALA
jgi:hypothetical protein